MRKQLLATVMLLSFGSLASPGSVMANTQLSQIEDTNHSAQTTLENTGNDTQETLQTTGETIKEPLQDTGTEAQETLEDTGTGIKDTLERAGSVPYRGLRRFFTGE